MSTSDKIANTASGMAIMGKTIFCLAIFLSANSWSEEKESIIRVVSDPWCPHVCSALEKDRGYMVEIAEQAMNTKGFQIKYENMAWSRGLNEVRVGHVNAIIGASKSDAPDFVFTSFPEGAEEYRFFTLKNTPWAFADVSSLEKVKVGVIKDYSYDDITQGLIAKKHPSFISVAGDKPLAQLIKMLKAKRIDAIYEGRSVFLHFVKNSPEYREAGAPEQTPQMLYVGFSPANKNSKALAKILDEGVEALRANGTLAEILRKYGVADWIKTGSKK